MNEFKCQHCEKIAHSNEGLQDHMKAKHSEHLPKETQPFFTIAMIKKCKTYVVGVLIILIVVWGFSAIGNNKSLPPTSMKGHIEVLPEAQVLDSPMRIEIFKHVIEHYDGETRPGVIITYDCKSYDCPSDLIQKLVAFTNEKPFVFVAPYKRQKNMIVVTTLNRQIKLDLFDQAAITRFIG